MKRDSLVVSATIIIYVLAVKGLEYMGLFSLAGVNDIIVLTLVALFALLLLIWHDPEVWDE